EGDARLPGLRMDLLDGAVHEPREVEWPAVELREPRPQARHLEDLIDEPEQPLGAQPDDVREASLSLRERAGGAVAEKLDRAVDRRERRPELVRDAREELGFRLLHPAELARHRVERSRERPDLVTALDRHARLTEVQRLPLAHRVLGEAPEILGDLSGPLGPRPRVARVAQHERARLEPGERRDRLAGGRGEAERGDGLGRDLAIDEDE